MPEPHCSLSESPAPAYSQRDLAPVAAARHRMAFDLPSRRRPPDSPGFDVEPRLGGVLGPPYVRRFQRGRHVPTGVGENVQLRTFLTRAAGAHAGGKARGRPAIRRRVMTPVLSTTDPDRGTEVNLDETQQSPR